MGENILLRGCTACEGFPWGSHRRCDEGAILSQPFLGRRRTYRPDAFLLPPVGQSIASHPPQCAHWGTFPWGRLWGGCVPFRPQHPPPPSPPSWGRAVTGVDKWAAAGKKGGDPAGLPKLEKVGPGRKNLFLPGVLFSSSDFLQRKRPPTGVGAPGRCAPEASKQPQPPVGYALPKICPRPHLGAAGRSNPRRKKKFLWSATRGRIPRRRATLSSCFLCLPGKRGAWPLCGEGSPRPRPTLAGGRMILFMHTSSSSMRAGAPAHDPGDGEERGCTVPPGCPAGRRGTRCTGRCWR